VDLFQIAKESFVIQIRAIVMACYRREGEERLLEVEFFLNHREDDLSIAKWLQTSKHCFSHIVKIDCEEDITSQLTEWVKRSYRLILC